MDCPVDKMIPFFVLRMNRVQRKKKSFCILDYILFYIITSYAKI